MHDGNQKPNPDAPQKLSDADQARVDAFLERGVNSVERKPFRPLFLLFLLMAVVAGFSLLSGALRSGQAFTDAIALTLARISGFWYSARLGV